MHVDAIYKFLSRFSVTVEPLSIESLWAEKRVFAGALGALDDSIVVQTKI